MKGSREYESLDCASCDMVFLLDTAFIDRRRKDHASFFCPRGHSNAFLQKTTEDILRAQLAEARQTQKLVKETIILEKPEGVTEHTHRWGGKKKPQCKICGLYKHMLSEKAPLPEPSNRKDV